MVEVWLPYGKTEICLRVPTRNFLGVIEPREKPGVPDARAEVERALKEPMGSKRLAEIVKPEHKVAVVVDDATRPTPSHIIVPPILDELNGAGVKDENVTIIFGCGAHRAVTKEEAARLLGEDVVRRVKTVSHDCKAQDLVYFGQTRFGTKVYLNRVFAEADVKVLIGDVCFHSYAGYGGGRGSVLPGVAGEETIKANHAMLLHPNARTGILEGNPVHEDMVEAAKMAKVNFILNVVLNSKGEIVKAFAGDLEKAFNEGVKLVDEMYRVPVDRRADIVVVSSGGYPADVNLFQACKSVDSVLEIVKRGGVIVLVAECSEGHGNQAFYDWMVKFRDLKAVEREIKRNFTLGGHKAYYLMKALQKAQIILVSIMPNYYAVNVFRLKTARTANEALQEAFKTAGEGAKVWAVPYGNYILPEVKTSEP
ncbi:MAG: nickel-dependent lactate racemase [Candidatus Bathyarchaeota archaeon]|nr:nickel-dependent lactate racemase [Candidatus Bathyarchaeota archaeon]